jgi:multisubunit Na+/H+ antiporter MnhB subunit
MAAPDQLYRAVTRLFSVIIVGFGIAIVVITLANGGGPLSAGVWIGLLFTGLGAARLYLALRSRS